MRRPSPALGSALFALVGPGLEAGVGPAVLTGGFAAGDAWADVVAVRVLGGLVVAAGLVVVAWCLVAIARDGRGTPSPAAPTARLVARGPYGVVRHPLYVATTAVIAGEGLLLSRPVLLVGAAAYLLTVAALVRLREERVLRARFGAAHDAYVAAVPDWLPGLRRR